MKARETQQFQGGLRLTAHGSFKSCLLVLFIFMIEALVG